MNAQGHRASIKRVSQHRSIALRVSLWRRGGQCYERTLRPLTHTIPYWAQRALVQASPSISAHASYLYSSVDLLSSSTYTYIISLYTSPNKYNNGLIKKSIIYYLLLNLSVSNYKKETYSILITSLDIYNVILKKLQINKYKILLNILKNKILFILDRYNYNYNKIF